MWRYRDYFCPFLQKIILIGTCYDVLFCDIEITFSCTTSVCWGISGNTPGNAIMSSCVLKVSYMFTKLCIAFIILVPKRFCMVVVTKLEIFTATVICIRIGDLWYNCFINNFFYHRVGSWLNFWSYIDVFGWFVVMKVLSDCPVQLYWTC